MEDIKVKVQFFGVAKMNMEEEKIIVTLPYSARVVDLLEYISQKESSLKPLLEGKEHGLPVLILHNSMDIKRKDGLQTKLVNGDVVDIVTLISGG